jgi:TP901 family phage tail tape measure protein
MGFLPPIVAELRAVNGQLRTKVAESKADIKALAAETEASSGRMTNAFKIAGAASAVVGAALLVAAGASVKLAADYQTATTQLVTGAGESEKNIGKVKDGLLAMAPAVGIGPTALAKAMFLVESAGYHGAAGLDVMKAAAEGAKIGGADAAVVANALTTAMTDYNIPTSKAAEVTSKLVATVASGKTNMADLAGAMSAVAPTAAAAHISLDQMLGSMATMTGEGISAQQSAQNLSGVIRAMSNPSQVMTKNMAAMGLSSIDVAQNLGKKGLTGTMSDLTTAILAHMGPAGLVLQSSFNQSKIAAASAQEMLTRLPKSLQGLGKEYLNNEITQKQWQKAMKGQDVLTANLGMQFSKTAKNANGFTNQLRAGGGSAQTFNGIMSNMTGGATGLGVALALTGTHASTFTGNVATITKAATEAGGHVKGWGETQKDLSVTMEQASAQVQAMAIKVGTVLIPVVQTVVKTVMSWTTALSQNKPLLLTIVGIVGGILVTAIAAYTAHLVVAAVESLKSFGKMVAAGTSWAVSHIASFAKAIASGAVWLVQSTAQFATWIAKQATVLAQGIALNARYYGPMLAGWVAKNATAFAGMIAKGAAWVAATAVQLASSAAKWVTTTAGTVAALAAQSAAMIAQKAVLVAGAVVLGVVTAAQWLWNVAMDANPIGLIIMAIVGLIAIIVLIATKTTFFQDVWKGAVAVIGAAWNWLWNSVIKPVGDFIGTAIGVIGFAVSTVFGAIGGVIKGAFNGVVSFVRSIFNTVIDIVNGIIGAINTVLSAGKDIGINVQLPKLPHFDVGTDRVPGPDGAPLLSVNHGGEAILSNDMLGGRAKIPSRVVDAVNSSQASGSHSTSSKRVTNNVTVNATTNASPRQIATTASWELRRLG